MDFASISLALVIAASTPVSHVGNQQPSISNFDNSVSCVEKSVAVLDKYYGINSNKEVLKDKVDSYIRVVELCQKKYPLY